MIWRIIFSVRVNFQYFHSVYRFHEKEVKNGHFFKYMEISSNHCFQICFFTVWKFQDFSITQILREINFEDSRSGKTAFFAFLGATNHIINFVNLVNFSLQKVQKFIKIKALYQRVYLLPRLQLFLFSKCKQICGM